MAWWQKLIGRRRGPISISLGPGGFGLDQNGQTVAVKWRDIVRIAAFKRDLITVDMICLAVETGDFAIELNDGMPGFDTLLPALDSALGIDPSWQLRVMFPAFEANMEMIFDRKATAI